MKIMLVDDYQVNNEIVGSYFKSSGHEVITTSNGLSAINYLESELVDLVIADLHMPYMDGIELTKEIRKSSLNAQVPVVILSAESNERVKQKAFEAQISDWVEKPIDFKKAVKILGIVSKLTKDMHV